MCAVEWKKLGDVFLSIKTGKLNANAMTEDGEYPFFTCDEHPYKIDSYAFDTEAVIITGNGSQVGHINYYIGKFNAYQRTYVLSNVNNAYIFYCLHYLKCFLRDYIFKYAKKGSVPYITMPMLEDFEIPLPAIEKQKEIAKHLDTFTTLISNLESELDMRRKQYEHYRNQLLDFEGVEKLPLSEIFEMRGGYTPSTKNEEFWEDGILPWFRMEDIRENGNILSDSTLHITPKAVKKNGLFPMNSIILATSATIGVHALLTVPALSNQRFTAFYPKEKFEDKVNYKYTYYVFYIIDEWCKNNTVQGGFASVDMAGLRKYLFPLPSLAKQQEIVEKLDAFENLIQSLEQEIKLRKQQYEYYREKLLTFEKE